ncbi:MAG: hypothetical protein ACOC3T_02110 [Bacteroidota bacterium]
MTGLVLVFVFPEWGQAQEDLYEKLLEEEVEVENPVYMPVFGVGPGVLRYYGDIKNKQPMLSGNSAVKINVSTFLDNDHFFKSNFFILLLGKLSGQQYTPISEQMNFSSEFTTFGLNIQYSFEHIIPPEKTIHPFVSAGIELFQFVTKTDIYADNGDAYQFYPDGTIRNTQGDIITRDYSYETDVRQELDYGLGKYAQNSLAIPFEIGVDFKVTDRANLMIGTFLHYALTDLIDHVSHKNTKGVIGKKGNDMYGFSYVTFHYDLFSDDETTTVKKLFADVDFDYTMYGDEDNDMVFDRVDECPGTPDGVEVDSVGCPFDDDNDGVPNYLDKEEDTPEGAWVNEHGVALSSDDLIEMLNNKAVDREDVKAIMRSSLSNKYYAAISNVEIPDKYKQFDKDDDGYLSFDEVLSAMDRFFNGEIDMTSEEIDQLKDFFFSQ